MTRSLALLVGLIALGGNAKEIQASDPHRIAGTSVNLRASPSTTAKIAGVLPYATPVNVRARTNGWAEIEIIGSGGSGTAGLRGFVQEKFVRVISPTTPTEGANSDETTGDLASEERKIYLGDYARFKHCVEWFQLIGDPIPPTQAKSLRPCLAEFKKKRRDHLERAIFHQSNLPAETYLELWRLMADDGSPYHAADRRILRSLPAYQFAAFQAALRARPPALDFTDEPRLESPTAERSFFKETLDPWLAVPATIEEDTLQVPLSPQWHAPYYLTLLRMHAVEMEFTGGTSHTWRSKTPLLAVALDPIRGELKSHSVQLVYRSAEGKISFDGFEPRLTAKKALLFFLGGLGGAGGTEPAALKALAQAGTAKVSRPAVGIKGRLKGAAPEALAYDLDGDGRVDLLDIEIPLDEHAGCFGKESVVYVNSAGQWAGKKRYYLRRCLTSP
ncbi:MAG: SH3 domain-containing protein [Bacteriovoracia bacterium]